MRIVGDDKCCISCNGAINKLVVIRIILNQVKSEKSIY